MFQITPSVEFANIPGALPTKRIPDDVDLTPLPQFVKDTLENPKSSSFTSDALWRDFLCMTGGVRTLSEDVARIWREQFIRKHVSSIDTKPASTAALTPESSFVAVPFEFKTEQDDGLMGLCSGTAGLVQGGDDAWKIWILSTMLEQFDGHGNPDIYATQDSKDAQSNNGVNSHSSEETFDVTIIGAGQSGLCLAGRLAALGVSYVILDRNPRIGDSWTGKYDTVKQHTVRQYNHLPFDPTWSKDEPLLLPAKKVAEGFQNYVRKYNINVWLSTTIEACDQNLETGDWTVKAERDGSTHVVKSKHLALGLGAGLSEPRKPVIANEDSYEGELLHAVKFKNSKSWKGKSGTIIGSGTSAHDIAQDMLSHGISPVTLIQRTKTAVFPVEWHVEGIAPIYNDTLPIGLSDRITMTTPNKIGREILRVELENGYLRERPRFAALEKAGFKVDYESPLFDKIFRDYGGYYIDVGASKEVAEGNIKVKSGVPIKEYTKGKLATLS